MSDWFETRAGLWGRAWDRLDVPRTQIAFGTTDAAGWPEVRTVVLRKADRAAAVFEVYTDIRSDKIPSIKANPRAALHLWDAELALQIRMQAQVDVLTGDTVRARWDAVPDHARQSYGVTPPPGQEIGQSLAYEKTSLFADFAVLSCRVEYVDLVHLGAVHRRAGFSRLGDWAGKWLVP